MRDDQLLAHDRHARMVVRKAERHHRRGRAIAGRDERASELGEDARVGRLREAEGLQAPCRHDGIEQRELARARHRGSAADLLIAVPRVRRAHAVARGDRVEPSLHELGRALLSALRRIVVVAPCHERCLE